MAYSEFTVIATTNDAHVHNHELYNFLNDARLIWHQYCIMNNVVAFVANCNVSFKKETFNGDHLYIRTWLDRVGNSSFTLKQSMYNPNNVEVVTAETVLATMDLKSRTKVRAPEQLRELLAQDIKLTLDKEIRS